MRRLKKYVPSKGVIWTFIIVSSGGIALGAWVWGHRTPGPPIVPIYNAYCDNGKCFRSNGMYIGPDPLGKLSMFSTQDPEETNSGLPKYNR